MELTLSNRSEINRDLEKEQKSFLNSTLGRVINAGIDIGIRTALPDLLEDEAIKVKNIILENGFKARLRKCNYFSN